MPRPVRISGLRFAVPAREAWPVCLRAAELRHNGETIAAPVAALFEVAAQMCFMFDAVPAFRHFRPADVLLRNARRRVA